ncbi:CGNR zinc finger domain-containing protein, partial [Streptomyces brevispora]|uniref:CGNR zinc finger domain-containing protein n=1 Tax=Streptomyces brevispora TaxID=887462 RepID=UPI0033E6A03F
PRNARRARTAPQQPRVSGSGEQRDALRACRAPGCILFFVQSGPARQWCSSGCGNRVRVARHANRAKITVDDSG